MDNDYVLSLPVQSVKTAISIFMQYIAALGEIIIAIDWLITKNKLKGTISLRFKLKEVGCYYCKVPPQYLIRDMIRI